MRNKQANEPTIKLKKKKPIAKNQIDEPNNQIDERVAFLNELTDYLDNNFLIGEFRVSDKDLSKADIRTCEERLNELTTILFLTIRKMTETISNITKSGGMVEYDSEIDGHIRDSSTLESAILTIVSSIGYTNKNVSFSFKTYYGFYAYMWFMLYDIFECQSNQGCYGCCPSWWDNLKHGAQVTGPGNTYELRTLIVALKMAHFFYAKDIDSDEANMGLGTITLEQARALGVIN